MTRNKLHIVVLLLSLSGYLWIGSNYLSETCQSSGTSVCLIKHATGYACPSCGSTRSVIALLNGDLSSAIYQNPIGIILLIMLVTIPPWIFYDYKTRTSSFLYAYQSLEIWIKQKRVAVPLAIVVALNWIWNIYKGV